MNENLLDPCIVDGLHTTQQETLPPKNLEEQKAEGKAAVWIKLNNNLNQLSTVDFEIIPAKMPVKAYVIKFRLSFIALC